MKILILISIIITSTAHGITRDDLIEKVLEVTPDTIVRAYDSNYASHTSKSFRYVKSDYSAILREAFVDLTSKKILFDCEDFSRLFRAASSLQIIRDYKNYAVGNVLLLRSKGSHMLNIALVNDEFVIIEPQTLKSVPFEEFAKTNKIVDISF